MLTLGEIRKGVESLSNGERTRKLRDWPETALPAFFAGSDLAADNQVANRWGRLLAELMRIPGWANPRPAKAQY